jgi:hypothetical protein
MPVVVEKPRTYFEKGDYNRNIHLDSVKGTIEHHPKAFYMNYFFCRDRRKSEQLTYEFLRYRYNQMEKHLSA